MADAFDTALVAYLWRNYGHFFSLAERRAAYALVGEGRIAAYVTRGGAPVEYADELREVFGSIEAPETKALLADGVDLFYRRDRRRGARPL
jgi:hypothetical protein